MKTLRHIYETVVVDSWFVIKRMVLFMETLYLGYYSLNRKFVLNPELQNMAKWGIVLEIFLLA